MTTEDQTLWTLFHRRAAQHPGRTCVSDPAGVSTYGDIDERSAAVATALAQNGVEPGDFVLVCLNASADFLVTVLACFRLRAVYVPIDPSVPMERLATIVEDIAPAAIVTDRDGTVLIAAVPAPHIVVGGVPSAAAHVDAAGQPGDAAYVIYTSGSTGRPKGVMVTHASVLHLVEATNQEMDLCEDDVWSATHSYAFDVSVWEVWSAIANGGRVVMVPRATVRAPDQLLQLLVREGVTVLSQTPTALYQLIAAEAADSDTARQALLRYVVLAGEALDTARVERWHDARVMTPLLVNLYGITEGTVHVTFFDLTPPHRQAADGRSMIGDAFGDGVLHLLDAELRPVSSGGIGELYLAGPGIALGYWKMPSLTASRFVACPETPGSVMYRSGDLARRTSIGLEYLGRADRQIKIRGYRIELGEIQSALDAQLGVRDSAIVVDRPNGGSARLIAYLRARPGSTVPQPQRLRDVLARRLPDYMLPAAFVTVEDWPTTQNGKLDEAALPRPTRSDRTSADIVTPRNEREQNVVDVWREVLGITEIGVYDDFFHLGGDSMAAHRVARKLLPHGYVDARQVLQARRPAELAILLAASPTEVSDDNHERTEPRLTPTQRRFWYEQLEQPDSAHLNVSIAFELGRQPDPERLRQAIDACVARSDVLRTRFELVDGEASIYAAPPGPSSWEWRHLTGLSGSEGDARLSEVTGRPFDLAGGPTLRAHLVEVDARPPLLTLVIHHAVVDGWSLTALIDAISKEYRGEQPLAPAPLGRSTAGLEQRLAGARREQLRGWWAQELANAPTPARPTRITNRPTAGAAHRFSIAASTASALQRLATGQGVTLHTVLMTLVSVVLARTVDRDETIIGLVVSGRDDPRLADVAEPTINTVPARLPVLLGATVAEAIIDVRERLDTMLEYQALPFEEILTAARVPRIAGQLPLLDAIVVLQDTPPSLILDSGAPAVRVPIPRHSAVHNLSIEFVPSVSGELEVMLEYRLAAMSSVEAARLESQLRAVIADAVADPGCTLGDLDMLGVDGAAQLARFETAPVPPGETLGSSAPDRIFTVFRERAAAIALSDDEGEMTYSELDRASVGLARLLARLGVRQDNPVAIRVERGRNYVIALLAVWRAGGVPVLLDPQHPATRARGVIEESGARVSVQSQATIVDLGAQFSVELGDDLDYFADNHELPARLPGPAERAYIIYTSGSTGKPKGVVVTHAALEVLVLAHLAHFQFTAKDRTAHFSGLGFDASIWDIVPALCAGARIDIPAPGHLDSPSAYGRWLAEHGTTVCFISTPVAELLFDESSVRDNDTLRLLLTGGSALTRRPPRAMRPSLVNNYGPTETTIIATTGPVAVEGTESGMPHIGAPRAGVTLHILDKRLHAVAPGVPGELYIAGTGLAEGYVSHPALTSERFVADPHGRGGRMYRSGDVAAWTDDGFVRYLGRNDSQLQVRGVRVELAEITQTLSAVCGSRQTYVLASSTGHDAQLDAFVVGAASVDELQVRAALSRALPDQMIPRSIHRIDALPLTPNDKVDEANLREILAQIGKAVALTEVTASPLTGDRVECFRALWREVLAVSDVADDANYFALGGDSIRTLKLVARARQAGFVLTSQDVFDHQTFAELAAVVNGAVVTARIPVSVADAAPQNGWAPLLPAQHLLLTELHGSPLSAISEFHQVLRVGVHADAHNVSTALQMLTARHPALRTAVRFAAGAWWQVERDESVGEVVRIIDTAEAADSWVTGPMAIEMGEMVRATILPDADTRTCELIVAIHHLAVDNVSWTVLLDELDELIQGHDPGPRLATDASEHARRLRYLAQSTEGAQLAQRWARQEAGTRAVEAPLPAGRYGDAQTISVALSAEDTEELVRRVVPQLGVTMDEVLVTALGSALVDWTGPGTYRIALEGHGRDASDHALGTEQTIGWLTAYTPVSLRFSGGPYQDRLRDVQDTLCDLPEPRATAAALRFSGRPGALATVPRPWISLNYLSELRPDRTDMFTRPPAMELHAATHLPRLHAIDVVASVHNGVLTLAVTHPCASDADEMARLIETIRAVLLEVVADGQRAVGLGRRLPLTDLQSGLLMHTLADRERNLYVEQARIRLPYVVESARMQRAWDAAVAATEVLRISLQWRGVPEPVQLVHPSANLPVQIDDLRALPYEVRGQQADLLAAEDRRSGTTLTQAPLACVRLIVLGDAETELVWTFQHLVLDGWSAMKVLGGVLDRYASDGRVTELERPAAVPSFSDYVRWLRRADTSAAELYWADLLARTPDRVTGFGARTLGLATTRSTAELRVQFAFELAELERAARRLRVTRGVLAQAAWALLLAGTRPRANTVFGVVVSGRSAPLEGIEDTIGLLINTVPMIVEVDSEMSVAQFVTGVQARSVQIQEHEHLSLPRIQKLAGAATNRLFDSTLVVENYPLDDVTRHGIELLDIRFDTGTNYPLNLVVHTAGSRGQVDVLYDDRVHSAEDIASLTRRYEEILVFLMRSPSASVGDAPRERDPHPVSVGGGKGTTLPSAVEPAPFDDDVLTLVESRVATCFQDVLNVPVTLRADAHFLSLGGDSLSALRLMGRLETEFGVEVNPIEIFDAPTVRQVSTNILRRMVEQLAEDDAENKVKSA